jgi:hypothetical protein
MKVHRLVRRISRQLGSQMAVRLSALRAGRPLPPKKIPGTHFCQRLSRPQGHSAAERIRSTEKITLSGPEPPTFRLVALCLNQLRYRMPPPPHTHITNFMNELSNPEQVSRHYVH